MNSSAIWRRILIAPEMRFLRTRGLNSPQGNVLGRDPHGSSISNLQYECEFLMTADGCMVNLAIRPTSFPYDGHYE
jgi:hypothetical protein